MTIPDPLLNDHARMIAEFAAANRLPAIYHRDEFAHAGGLMSYAPDQVGNYRRAATIVDRILKGSVPADIPVEEPTKMALVVNLKAARTLNLRIPQSILLRADKVME